MRLIAFDTATEWCTAALWLDGALHWREARAGQRHSDLLVPMIMDLLAEAGLKLGQLDGLAYGMGPGSFTGLRIACGVAQGLALGSDLRVVGVSTLEALAQEAWNQRRADRVLACLDARMQEVYAGLYRRQDEGWLCQAGPLVCAPQDLPAPPAAGYTGAGPGFLAHAGMTSAWPVPLLAVAGELIPHARAIAHLAVPRLARGEGLPAEAAEPLYIRDKVALKIRERAHTSMA
ncbi:MAG TPA: tRNA (adenosine(37)-N6)-threonylcarbamoyltransferase complex dimerization subunit type 1 TsaB [Thiobacillaceae bacterium]|nr:tRNA (adenosine(37)-N6)-threonylcarbamoyltransferase complex dimerization subunit type 1 TsaB [Thiobacillaceae bacterium]HNU62986.1 tRNA (adenosine(37)-N6)-threonylcarbamoyltransferase complex dimerization subunit type 1 TsaB [Thiobacillaceae bacterium]